MSIFKKFDREGAIELTKLISDENVLRALRHYNLKALIRFLDQVNNLYSEYWAQGKMPPMLSIAGMWNELMALYDLAKTIPGDEIESIRLISPNPVDVSGEAGEVKAANEADKTDKD